MYTVFCTLNDALPTVLYTVQVARLWGNISVADNIDRSHKYLHCVVIHFFKFFFLFIGQILISQDMEGYECFVIVLIYVCRPKVHA